MIAVILLLLVAAVLLAPYIKRAWERLIFFGKVKKICQARHYIFKKNGYLKLYFSNFSGAWDISVDTGKTVYAVKLWGEVYKNAVISIEEDGTVSTRRKIREPFSYSNQKTHRVNERVLGKIALPPSAAPKRRVVSVLAISPAETNVFYLDTGGVKKVAYGERVCGMILSSFSGFLFNLDR